MKKRQIAKQENYKTPKKFSTTRRKIFLQNAEKYHNANIEENPNQIYRDSNVVFNDKIDSLISYKKWFFGHWHSDWGYEHYKESKYVPLYHQGIVIKT